MGTEQGINIFNEHNDTFTYIMRDNDNPNSLLSNNIRDIFKDSKGQYWIATADSGVIVYNKENKSFTNYKHHPYKTA